MDIKDLMKERRIAAGLTMKELADKVGVSESTISRYESGDVANMKLSNIKALSSSLGIDPMCFINNPKYNHSSKQALLTKYDNVVDKEQYDVDDLYNPEYTNRPKNLGKTRLPVLGNVAGGVPIEALQSYNDTYEEIPASWVKSGDEFFALVVKGDSMYPRIANGDVAIIKKCYEWISGAVMAVYINGYNATLKRVRVLHNGTIVLEAFNPEFETQVYSAEDVAKLPVKPLGVLVESRAKWE